jgi:Phage phiEco32-like COOH.NH2 ligase-type 2
MKFTFGADPEFIIANKNDEIKSAIGILPKKEKAFFENGNGYYFDNMLAEIAVKPAENEFEILSNIKQALKGLANFINPNKFLIKASSNYPKKEINCIDAKIVGCNPEWNVYTLKCVFPPEEDVYFLDGYYQFKNCFRSAGGHIHIGCEMLYDSIEALNTIRMMDLFLGIPSVFLDTDETSKKRRKIYGHAGSHRITDYGIEYRALGNFWLSSPDLVSLMYNLTDFTLKFVETKQYEKFWIFQEEFLENENPSCAYQCFGYDVNLMRKAINTCDKKLADKFMIFISNYLPNHLIEEIERLSEKPLKNPYDTWLKNN